MTRDDMIRLAREAGWDYANDSSGFDPLWKFGELVAAAEREACLQICQNIWQQEGDKHNIQMNVLKVAEAIRARGQHD